MIQEKNKITNIGIFAHVDAGKTTITENLLYECGILKKIGRVDKGNTQTDTMIQERERGISIKAAPISFLIDDLKVNLIDTPGHVDFLAEVERTINILDGAILVLSAKEGIQSHTFLLFNSLKKLGIPIIFFINKIDRTGCSIDNVLNDLKLNLTSHVFPIQRVYKEGTREANVSEIFHFPSNDICDWLADHDETLLYRVLNDEIISDSEIKNTIVNLSANASIYPLIFGSALLGTGIRQLCESIKLFLSLNIKTPKNDDVSWHLFKISRTPENIKQVYIRVFTGVVNLWDTFGNNKVTNIKILNNGKTKNVLTLPAGEIGIIQGLNDYKINDFFGNLSEKKLVKLGQPTLRYTLKPKYSSDIRKLIDGIDRIAESDPYLDYEQNNKGKEIFLNLFGDIQMEIIKDILIKEHNVEIEFHKPDIIYKETVKSDGRSLLPMFHKSNPYYATIGIKVEPNFPGTGNIVQSEEAPGSFPKGLVKGALNGIKCYLRQGLKGWEITDTVITITKGDFECIACSTPDDFRNLSPMVLFEALEKAETRLLWPILKFEIKIAEKYYGKIIEDLRMMQAKIVDISENKNNFYISGTVPAEYFQNYHKVFIEKTDENSNLSFSFNSYEDAPNDITKTGRKIYPDPSNKFQYIMSKKGLNIQSK